MSRPSAGGDPGADVSTWYGELREEFRKKPPEDVSHEFPNLVEQVRGLASAGDPIVVGASFTKHFTGLDYSLHRMRDEYLEPIKEPVSATHRYVRFTHPPDHHFDASALRARLLGAIDRERRNVERPRSTFADLWSQL